MTTPLLPPAPDAPPQRARDTLPPPEEPPTEPEMASLERMLERAVQRGEPWPPS